MLFRLYKHVIFSLLSACIAIFLTAANVNAAKEMTFIPVPKNVIYSGQLITKTLLRDRKVPVDYVNRVSIFAHPSEAIGKVARKTLMPNQPIFTNNVTEPDVVKVNRPTIMEYSSGSLIITAEVLPLSSAKAGEYVRVRNTQNGSVVSGIAMQNGTIKVQVLR